MLNIEFESASVTVNKSPVTVSVTVNNSPDDPETMNTESTDPEPYTTSAGVLSYVIVTGPIISNDPVICADPV